MDYGISYTPVGWVDVEDVSNPPESAQPIDATNLSFLDNGIKEVFERTSDLNERVIETDDNYNKLISSPNRVISFPTISPGIYIESESIYTLSYTISNFKKDAYTIFAYRSSGFTDVTSALANNLSLGLYSITAGSTTKSQACSVGMSISTDGNVTISIYNGWAGGTLSSSVSVPTLYMFSTPLGVEVMS